MKIKNYNYKIIGLMSGTSMDGINACIVNTNGQSLKRLNYKDIYYYSCETVRFLNKISDDIKVSSNIDSKRYIKINKLITFDHYKAVKKLTKNFKLKPDFIGFHGQTILHDPKNKSSIQLGIPKLLARLCKIPVISNFRDNDLINGGQGAPIAPIYHKYLIDSLKLEGPTCIINIGGISNVTYSFQQNLIGFDTGPGNVLMDNYMQTYKNLKFDKNGQFASKGQVNKKFINYFTMDDFFKYKYPKSLDKNYFADYLATAIRKIKNEHDLMSTLNMMTAKSIAISLDILPIYPKNIIITGGGANNLFLLENLKRVVKAKVFTGNEVELPNDMIEAELIAYLSARHLNGLCITYPNTTGVIEPISGGIINNI